MSHPDARVAERLELATRAIGASAQRRGREAARRTGRGSPRIRRGVEQAGDAVLPHGARRGQRPRHPPHARARAAPFRRGLRVRADLPCAGASAPAPCSPSMRPCASTPILARFAPPARNLPQKRAGRPIDAGGVVLHCRVTMYAETLKLIVRGPRRRPSHRLPPAAATRSCAASPTSRPPPPRRRHRTRSGRSG